MSAANYSEARQPPTHLPMGDPEGDGVALQLLDTLLLVVAVSDTLALAEGSDDAPSTQWRGTTCNGTREVNPLRHLPLPSHTPIMTHSPCTVMPYCTTAHGQSTYLLTWSRLQTLPYTR